MSDLSVAVQNNILIVDDVLDNLDLLSRILTRRGYTVRSVEAGISAIAIAQSGWADLILLDINMPEMDGYEVCRRLKADSQTENIPIVFLSALDEVLDKVTAFGVGGVDYITKPFQIKEVVARVKTHLQLRNLQKSLEIKVASRTRDLAMALQEAKAANSSKNVFFSQITHELRTPMNAVLGFVQLMQRDKQLSPEQQKYLQIINHSGEHLMALINDVLEVSKIEAGRLILEKNNFDLYRLLKNIEEMWGLKAQAQNVEFGIERGDLVPRYIQADQQKLQQVLINFLANAVKFTQVGQITLTVDYNPQKPSQIIFAVADTGLGISPTDLDLLFNPFVQTEAGRNSKSGTGLGLSICREYIELMGGQIQVVSEVNQGSTFSFNIPIELGYHISDPTEPRRVISLKPSQLVPKILVVEDRWENRQFLARLLEIVGFEVKEAENGKEAIAIWSEWSPELILMDLQMPIMDGYEATQHIKRQNQSVKIIAITASNFQEQKKFILTSGCDDLLSIPFQAEELWSKLARYLPVEYVYEQYDDSITHLPESNKTNAEQISLSGMPAKWIEQLDYCASAANAKEIITLLADIPPEQSELAEAIARLADNFCFEQIIDLIQVTSN